MKKNQDLKDLLKKAEESLTAAEFLLEKQLYDFSAGRSYYSMFYLAEALLMTKGLSFSKHKSVISGFGKEFVKSGLLPRKLRDNLAEAFDLRQIGDYGTSGSVTKEKAEILIENTKEFIKDAHLYLTQNGCL